MMITGQKDKNEYKITKSEFTEKNIRRKHQLMVESIEEKMIFQPKHKK